MKDEQVERRIQRKQGKLKEMYDMGENMELTKEKIINKDEEEEEERRRLNWKKIIKEEEGIVTLI